MFELPELPYPYDALEPVISDRTLRFHHDKHHAAYVKTTNELLQKAARRPDSLEAVIREAARGEDRKLFNNAAQAWNHSFFWVAMSPERLRPEAELDAAIRKTFGDLSGLKSKFVEEGAGHFGSGWAWLACDGEGRLSVRTTHDADDTLTRPGLTPLMVCDLWEHAYYLDHQNDRKGFLEAWFDTLPNWTLAASQFAAAKGEGQAWRHPAPSAAQPARQARAG
jgi:Fe-Mn family superoxide dismutase